MKLQAQGRSRGRASCLRSQHALTLVEVLIAMMGVGILTVVLYASISQGFAIIQTAREDLRATQILQDKMETMRVYNWEQVTTLGFIPSSFTEPLYPIGDDNGGGLDYQGQVIVTNAFPLGDVSYANDLRWVIVQLQWQSGNVVRHREMRTLVSEFGLHSYVY